MANNVTGTVSRLYVSLTNSGQGVTFIRLNIDDAKQPKNSYFQLKASHPNYNALYSLALSAAFNRYPLRIRTETEISSSDDAMVQ